MEDFDIFTNEINFTKPLFKNILNKYVNEVPSTPNAPNYQSGRKLLAEECLSDSDDAGCAFQLSEAVSASIRAMAIYRDEQIKLAAPLSDKSRNQNVHKITSFIKPVRELVNSNSLSKKEENLLNNFLLSNVEEISKVLSSYEIDEKLPFHKQYLKFTEDNNVSNFKKILSELPKEWTIVQLTAPYNPNENLKPLTEYRTEISSIYLSIFTNDYLDGSGLDPITINIPANVNKEGEKPLFTELYSLLDENYKTIDNAQFLNNKRLVQNYWSRREDIDLRMKSVINVMDKEWVGGWGALLTGRLLASALRDRLLQLVDGAAADWGFIKLTKKQKVLLYNLIESSPALSSQQIKSCIRRILTEHGNPDEIKQALSKIDCENCPEDYRFLNELCLKCLSKSFEAIHHFSLADGIKAFSQVATQVKENDEWAALKQAKRHPVILIVDEMLDTFPWETLPILNPHPVSRMENIHFLYYLYKIHEKDIKGGYFTTTAEVGRYVINPEKNLDRMEKRMSSFLQYWCGGWRGHAGEAPPADTYLRYLVEADVFLYCGHGDGCQLAAGGAHGAGVEGALGARSVCVLSGCGSVRLLPAAGRAPPAAAHHHLHIAGCPLVIGMLWEVTDLEVDKMVATLMSLCVPSTAPVPWSALGKAKWSQGELDTKVEVKAPPRPSRSVLGAVSRARGSTQYALIASSAVARGLPVAVRPRGEAR